MTARKAKLLGDQIRAAVDASGLSHYAICRATGFDKGGFSRFMSGKGGLLMANLEALADLLGLEVVTRGQRKRKGR